MATDAAASRLRSEVSAARRRWKRSIEAMDARGWVGIYGGGCPAFPIPRRSIDDHDDSDQAHFVVASRIPQLPCAATATSLANLHKRRVIKEERMKAVIQCGGKGTRLRPHTSI